MNITCGITLKSIFTLISLCVVYALIDDSVIRNYAFGWLGWLCIWVVTACVLTLSIKISESKVEFFCIDKRIPCPNFPLSNISSCSITNFPRVICFGNGNRQICLPRFMISEFDLICAYIFANFPGQFEDENSLKYMRDVYIHLNEKDMIPKGFGNSNLIKNRMKTY